MISVRERLSNSRSTSAAPAGADARPGKRHEIWRLSNDGLMAPLLYDRRETGDGGRVEELAQRQLHLIGIAHSIQHLKRDQRFSAQFKEVVVNPDSFDTKDLLPDGREGLLKFMSG